MITNNDALLKILESREQRAIYQSRLIKRYHSSLVSFTLNIPGSQKDSELFREIHHAGMIELLNTIKDRAAILYHEVKFTETGPEGYICVNADAIGLKHLTVNLEATHALGRLFDFDVFNDQCKQISRIDVGYSERTCLLCSKNVHICRREQNHSIVELLEKINSMATIYFG
ncbi:holo-ACP synthase [Anaerosolibacter carboniphilus]|uniref:citrate lyase holo-[acyl-carrier protein] synthase n=1 Tax=Anaerosolibacter carboniphilus TaxID=1417629 RepID=A0A841KL34_9FIRM|nr:citrate lyase holo-[acyl-carrier protein] synthase [Anaerosolibacter carboniphilus]MBB6214157.1 holo-ACP synthase [Anaerosolibacter carboniphilus]